MPAKSEKQRRFFGSELARKRSGQKTKTHMTEEEMEEHARMTPKQRMMAKVEKIKKRKRY